MTIVALLTLPASSQAQEVKRTPVIRSIKYEGMPRVSIQEILERIKQRNVDFGVERRYDPAKVDQAKAILRELLAEKGQSDVRISSEAKLIPPGSIEVVFTVECSCDTEP